MSCERPFGDFKAQCQGIELIDLEETSKVVVHLGATATLKIITDLTSRRSITDAIRRLALITKRLWFTDMRKVLLMMEILTAANSDIVSQSLSVQSQKRV